MNLSINVGGQEIKAKIEGNNEDSTEMIKDIILVEKMSV